MRWPVPNGPGETGKTGPDGRPGRKPRRGSRAPPARSRSIARGEAADEAEGREGAGSRRRGRIRPGLQAVQRVHRRDSGRCRARLGDRQAGGDIALGPDRLPAARFRRRRAECPAFCGNGCRSGSEGRPKRVARSPTRNEPRRLSAICRGGPEWPTIRSISSRSEMDSDRDRRPRFLLHQLLGLHGGDRRRRRRLPLSDDLEPRPGPGPRCSRFPKCPTSSWRRCCATRPARRG